MYFFRVRNLPFLCCCFMMAVADHGLLRVPVPAVTDHDTGYHGHHAVAHPTGHPHRQWPETTVARCSRQGALLFLAVHVECSKLNILVFAVLERIGSRACFRLNVNASCYVWEESH